MSSRIRDNPLRPLVAWEDTIRIDRIESVLILIMIDDIHMCMIVSQRFDGSDHLNLCLHCGKLRLTSQEHC